MNRITTEISVPSTRIHERETLSKIRLFLCQRILANLNSPCEPQYLNLFDPSSSERGVFSNSRKSVQSSCP